MERKKGKLLKGVISVLHSDSSYRSYPIISKGNTGPELLWEISLGNHTLLKAISGLLFQNFTEQEKKTKTFETNKNKMCFR